MAEPRSEHLTPDVLEAFFEGTLPRAEMARAIAHLLEPCAGCRSLARRFGEIPRAAEAVRLGQEMEAELWDEDEVWAKVMEAVEEREEQVAREWEGVDETCDELLAMSKEERRQAIETEERFQTWALCERLIERAWELRFVDPRRKLDVATTAVWVSERLDQSDYGENAVSDLQGRALSHRANAYRILWNLQATAQDLDASELALKQGSRDPVELWTRLTMMSSYWSRADRPQLASEIAERAARVIGRSGSPVRSAWSLLELAIYLAGSEAEGLDPDNIIMLLEDAADTLGATDLEAVQPRLESREHIKARILSELALLYYDKSEYEEALSYIVSAINSFEEKESTYVAGAYRTKTEILLALGRIEDAEAAIKKSLDIALSHGTTWDVCEAVLRLGHLYLRTDEPQRAADVIRPLLKVWSSKVRDRNLTEALGILYEAAKSERLSEDVLDRFETASAAERDRVLY